MNFNLDLMLPYKDEVKAAVTRVIDSGWYLGGGETEAFEAEWAAFTGQRYVVGVGNGTDAIRIALTALGIGPGDEVLTPAHCVGFTALAIRATGATPVFVDVYRESHMPNVWDYERLITPRTKAIVPVHLYGNVTDMVKFMEVAEAHGLVVVEDAAHAHGAAGLGHAHATAYSFYPTKNLGALGEAGAINTNIPIVAERCRLLRDGGRTDRYVHEPPGGLNSMMDEVQAAVLRAKLPYLRERNAARERAAEYYHDGLKIPRLGLLTGFGPHRVWHLYVARTTHRDALRAHLEAAGVPTLIHYPLPVPLQPTFMGENVGRGPWPVSEEASREVLSLPLHADITHEEQDRVIDAVKSFFESAP